jgi:hypothetical protein
LAKRGQGAHVPTERDRDIVQRLRANGTPIKVIACAIGISQPTLYKRYRAELDYGTEHVIAALGAVILRAAMNGDWRAALSWLKRFGGPLWAEQDAGPSLPTTTTIVVQGGLPPWVHERPDRKTGNGLDH